MYLNDDDDDHDDDNDDDDYVDGDGNDGNSANQFNSKCQLMFYKTLHFHSTCKTFTLNLM